MKQDEESIAKHTFEFIKQYPFVIYAIKKGLINYSSLARLIQKETGIKKFDAILVALRRHQKAIRAPDDGRKILSILKNSSLEMRTGVNIYRLKELDQKIINGLKHFHLIHGGYGKIELITDEQVNMEPKKKNLLEVKIKSPPTLESTPGVVGYIMFTLAAREINVVKTYSCHTDTTIFVFEKKDLLRVVNALESIGIK